MLLALRDLDLRYREATGAQRLGNRRDVERSHARVADHRRANRLAADHLADTLADGAEPAGSDHDRIRAGAERYANLLHRHFRAVFADASPVPASSSHSVTTALTSSALVREVSTVRSASA